MSSSQCDSNSDNDKGCDASEGKTVMHFDSKDLILQFTKMNVTLAPVQISVSSPPATSTSSTASIQSSTNKVNKNWKFKAKPDSKQQQRSFKVVLRPSRLNLATKKDGESLFRDFSVACTKELDSIARSKSCDAAFTRSSSASTKKKQKKDSSKVTLSPATHHGHHACQKRRKASSCAEQARQHDDLSDTIDLLADYLEESVMFPKKMSYMAELMYT